MPMTLLVAAIPLAWLLPNHYLPWPSAWQDGMALALLFLGATFARSGAAVSLQWLAVVTLVVLSVTGQWLAGLVVFGGDALLVGLYAAGFLISIALGSALVVPNGESARPALESLAMMILAAAMISLGIALAQWTHGVKLGIWAADLPMGARPFANVAQPNHFSSIAFLGICAAFLLRESRRMGELGLWFTAVPLLFGMALSGSRTGWLQVAALAALALVCARRSGSFVRPVHVVALVVTYALVTWLLPFLNEASQLSSGRSVTHQIEGGVRFPLWVSLWDAVTREPWWGYGWQQVAQAQQAVALDHPPLHRMFEHSHNMALDLLLWAGIPVGLCIIVIGLRAMAVHVRTLRDPRALWLCAAAIGLGLHAQVELPLEYAYFLLPLGLALGAIDALDPVGRRLVLNVWVLRGAGLCCMLLLAAVASEYLQAEQSHRLLRLETARIGTTRIESKSPDLRLLTQLEGLLNFARTEARPGMDDSEVARMRDVAQRYPFPPVMFRHALVEGLHGQPERAALILRRLCSVHSIERCDEARESWPLLQGRYKELLIVPSP